MSSNFSFCNASFISSDGGMRWLDDNFKAGAVGGKVFGKGQIQIKMELPAKRGFYSLNIHIVYYDFYTPESQHARGAAAGGCLLVHNRRAADQCVETGNRRGEEDPQDTRVAGRGEKVHGYISAHFV
jgi:hypothetical protein